MCVYPSSNNPKKGGFSDALLMCNSAKKEEKAGVYRVTSKKEHVGPGASLSIKPKKNITNVYVLN